MLYWTVVVTQNGRSRLRAIPTVGNANAADHDMRRAATQRKKVGRPTDYTPEIAREIADRMIDGDSLRSVCQRENMPHEGTVYRWIARHPEFRELYAHARELQAMRWAEEVLSIADDTTLEPHDRRIRVDTRKWLLSKVLPKVYGDKVTLAGDPKAPIQHLVGVIDLEALSVAELDALEAFTQARLAALSETNTDPNPAAD